MQRDQGRDLFDLARALQAFDGLDTARVVEIVQRYLALQELDITRAQAEQRMLSKLARAGFLADIRPLLSAEDADALTEESMNAIFMSVFDELIGKFPGHPWARTDEMKERLGLVK